MTAALRCGFCRRRFGGPVVLHSVQRRGDEHVGLCVSCVREQAKRARKLRTRANRRRARGDGFSCGAENEHDL